LNHNFSAEFTYTRRQIACLQPRAVWVDHRSRFVAIDFECAADSITPGIPGLTNGGDASIVCSGGGVRHGRSGPVNAGGADDERNRLTARRFIRSSGPMTPTKLACRGPMLKSGLSAAGGSASVLKRFADEHFGQIKCQMKYLMKYVARWVLLATPLGIAVGTACALFLWLLDRVTELRWQHGWLLFLLPVAGALVALLYNRFGCGAEGGTNLIVDEIHEPGAGGEGGAGRWPAGIDGCLKDGLGDGSRRLRRRMCARC